MAEIWGAAIAGTIAAGGAIYSANSASKTASNAAKQAAWTPVNVSGPSGNIGVTTDSNGVTTYNNNGSLVSQTTAGPLAQGAAAAQNRTNALAGGTPFQALASVSPELTGAYNSAQGAFSDINNPGAFFGATGANDFQQQNNNANTVAGLTNTNAQTALNGGGNVGAINNVGNNAAGAANSAFGALSTFDPNAYAANAKSQLDALAAPGDTSATQSLFNSLQSTGRLGLTQNGELGDIGGLALAQSTANNQRALQAAQLGQSVQQNLVSNANSLAGTAGNSYGTGANLTTNALSNNTTGQTNSQNADIFGLNQLLSNNNLSQSNALQRFSLAGQALSAGTAATNNQQQLATNDIANSNAINSSDLNAQNSSINASAVRSGAQSNAGALAVSGANNTANNYGSLFAGLAPTLGKIVNNQLSTPAAPTTVPATSSGGGNGYGVQTDYSGAGVQAPPVWNPDGP